MNENELYRSLNEIDDDLLQRSETGKAEKKPQKFIRVLAAAAVLACVAGLGFLFRPADKSDGSTPLFVISVYAENGETVELKENEKLSFSSGSTGDPIYWFDADKPLFKFDFRSAQWEGERYPWKNYTVTFSYNGKEIEARDAHIMVANTIPVAGYEGTGGYFIVGWFEEPTDIEITVRDRESGELMERTVVHICYLAEEDTYELTVTEVTTYIAVK